MKTRRGPTLQELIKPRNGKWKKTRSKKAKKWVEWLRTDHKKGYGALKYLGHCCLGGYCEFVEGVELKADLKVGLPEDVGVDIPFLDQYTEDGWLLDELVHANDGVGRRFSHRKTGYTHAEIADWVEANLIRK